MLASITPLGERGRQSTWGVTVAAFLLGALGGGAGVGALAGALGLLAVPASVGTGARLAVVAVAALIATGVDARADPAPGPRRQVNEQWLQRYRGWVYGVGFGAQLGIGICTVVSSAATYVALIAALMTRNPVSGAVILGCFGVVRGLTPLAAAGVDRPERLVAFHAHLHRLRAQAASAGLVALAAICLAAVVGAVS
jgi:hypothetical protein